jgi:hypothetical protein
MTKKTRKEKIIADLRRKVQSVQNFSVVPKETAAPTHIEPPKIKTRPLEEISQTESLYIYPFHLIRKDLTKTFLLSILAISLEVALFLLLEQHLVLPFRISF